MISSVDASDLAGRIKFLIGREPLAAFARRAGIQENLLRKYLAGSMPGLDKAAAIARAGEVTLDWLMSREPPVHTAKRIDQFIEATGLSASVPVIGLAECGLRGWYQEAPMVVSASRPVDLADAEAFAVIAIGVSMRPAGICQGFLCFCAPAFAPDKGDRVYVERADGTAAIKLYLGRDDTWLHLRGWLAPDEAGRQEPYDERLRLDQVARLAVIVYIKLKL